jgi:amidohydrolase
MIVRFSLCLLAAANFLAAQTPEARRQQVAKLADAAGAQVISLRRDFHQHPELSNREERTARVIAERLKALGFDEVRTGVAKHGIVALLKGSKPGPVVAWRADMDALPVTTTSTKPFKSQNAGVHHACGHDAHLAIALGAAEVLSKMRDQIPGAIKFIFQPAEEGAPEGEEGGAALMIKEGALANPKPAAIFALHVMSTMPTGEVHYVPGPAMASSDSLRVKIIGKQVHGAFPHDGVDSIAVAAQCINALQLIRSRRIDPAEAMVLSIGSIHGGNRSNIIAGEVTMEGTLRTFNENVRESSIAMMKQTLAGCTSAEGASYDFQFSRIPYPVTVNDPKLVEASLPEMQRLIGKDKVKLAKPMTGAEDFSYFQREIPGFMWWLGVRNEAKGIKAAHHTPDFDLDEDALVPGVKLVANQLLDYLERAR